MGRWWWLRALALAESGDWAELEKFSKSKKPPIGMEVGHDSFLVLFLLLLLLF